MSDFEGQFGNSAAVNFTRPIWPTYYVPAPPIPRWFKKALERKGGYNPLAQPNFKLVWGMDERTWCGDDPHAIKYVNPNDVELGYACFILERWAPPEFYDRREYETLFPRRPFPTQGIYIQCAILATEGEDKLPYAPLPLEQKVLDELLAKITHGPVKPNEILAARQLEKERRQEVAQKNLRKLLDDNFEYHRQKADLVNTLATRHTVAPSLSLPVKSNIDEARKLFIPNSGVNDVNTANAVIN